jgi:outer membrane protein insertion porin family
MKGILKCGSYINSAVLVNSKTIALKRLSITFVLTLLTFLFQVQVIVAQEKTISYSGPTEYTIGGITISGTKYLDPDVLISVSGLKIGDEINVPGDNISKAIRNLWDQGLFTDVQIRIVKTMGSRIFLDIYLQERPRLSKFAIKGIKKSEADDIREKLTLVKGRVVTDNTKNNTILTIKNYYKEKGFSDAKVRIDEIPDTTLRNSVILEYYIAKGRKVKIESINIEGNKVISDAKLKKQMKETKEIPRLGFKEIFNKKNIKEATKGITVMKVLNDLAPSHIVNYVGQNSNLNIFKSSKYNKENYTADKNKIIDFYNTKGYKDASIEFDTVYSVDGRMRIAIYINEGKQYYFRNITWKGNTKYSNEVLSKILNIQKGDIYNSAVLDEKLFMSQNSTDISSLYMDDGYLFFQVTPVEITIEDDSIDIEVRIYEGAQATINEVRVFGNTKTNEHVIRRELRTLPGSKFSRSDLIRSQREIVNLGFFNPESMDVKPIPNPEKGTVDIEYVVEEKPSDQLELSAGWGGRGRGIVGTVGVNFTNFSIQNMFKKGTWSPLPSGDGQRFSLRIQSNGKVFQSYNVSFTEPWLGGKKPNSLTVSYAHTRFANLNAERQITGKFITNGVSVGIGTRLKWPDDFFTFQSIANFQFYTLDKYPSGAFIFTDGKSNNFSMQFILSRNSLDRPLYPMSGSNVSLSLQVTPPYSLFSDKNYATLPDAEKYKWIEYHKWKLDVEWYVPIVEKLVLRTRAKLGFLGLYNEDIGFSPFERFDLGGDGLANFNFVGRDIVSMRGYDVITPSAGAPIYNKFGMEIRYPLSLNPSATIFVLGFVEGANFYNNFKDYNPFDVRKSAGIGLRVFLPMFGLLGFDYGIGFDKNLGPSNGFGDYLGKYGRFSIILGMEPQ